MGKGYAAIFAEIVKCGYCGLGIVKKEKSGGPAGTYYGCPGMAKPECKGSYSSEADFTAQLARNLRRIGLKIRAADFRHGADAEKKILLRRIRRQMRLARKRITLEKT